MLIVIAILFALIIAVYMSTSMGRTINRIRDVAGTAAKGDLTVIPSTNRRDELGLLTTSIASMITNMRQLINRASDITQTVANSASTVSSTSQQVSAVSQEISRAIQEISEGASAQASDAEQSALKMRQLAIKINTVSDNSKSIEHISHDTMDLTQNGLASIEALGEKAKETTEITREIMSDIQKLDENSKSIGKIIKVIGGIADQTNLLALNAAIEAARAGEMGKGFAVVADEVRKLAEQSMNSTREIGNIVKSTQEQTRQAVERAEKTEEIISSQNIAVENAIESFKDISSSMAKLVSSVKEILEGVVEMDADKEHTNLAIQNISAVSEETAASSEEVTASTEEQLSSIEELSQFATELGESAADLKDAISKFKVKKDDEE
jgi:methyl-accepting chemotaxis protein